MKKLTVKDLLALKGKRQLTEVAVSNADEARACEAAGIDMLVTGTGDLMRQVRAAAPNTFITGGLSYGRIFSETQAIEQAFDVLRCGADCVYACMSTDWIRAMTKEGIPVCGHVGLVPQRSTWYGGFKAVGKTATEAMDVYRAALAHQEAGAIAVEMEVVPHQIAAEISKRLDIMVISMGSGTGCDAQYLFSCDILGTHKGHVPRHAKGYADLHSEQQAHQERMHKLREQAFSAFKQDTDSGRYPEPRHLVEVESLELEKFIAAVDRK